ncbi:MAG: LAGLIDADG family homing endonuclease [Patescibacteria group bacterium]
MNANAVGKTCAEADRAYLAGLIDGDGCIMATIEKHSEKKFGFRVRVTVKITQKESRLVYFLAQQFRIGKIRYNRITHDWIIRDKSEVLKILTMIEPYAKAKLKQIVIAKKILKSSDATRFGLMKMARLADTLSKFNVRSKERRKNFAAMIKAQVSSND